MDVLFIGGLVSHIEVLLDEPGLERWFQRLARIARLILIDRRGTGMSSMPVDDWTVEDEIEGVRAAARQRKGWMFDTYLLRRAR